MENIQNIPTITFRDKKSELRHQKSCQQISNDIDIVCSNSIALPDKKGVNIQEVGGDSVHKQYQSHMKGINIQNPIYIIQYIVYMSGRNFLSMSTFDSSQKQCCFTKSKQMVKGSHSGQRAGKMSCQNLRGFRFQGKEQATMSWVALVTMCPPFYI